MKNKIFLTVAASLLALSLSTGASAAPAPMIEGSLSYSSFPGVAGAWSFDTNVKTVTIGLGEVDAVGGDFLSTISEFDTIAAVPTFTYDPFVPTTTIWSLGGFTFDLNAVTAPPIAGLLVLTGMGTVSSVGFADTTMAWTISGGQNSSFSASTVPEPSVIALFGLGLLGLGLARRKIRS